MLSEQFLRYNLCMVKIFIIFLLSTSVFGQDERFYQKLFQRSSDKNFEKTGVYKNRVTSDKYMLDLNRDSVLESFQIEKRDGIDAIIINDSFGKKTFEATLLPKGANSRIMKASFKRVSSNVDVLILHYYEGENKYPTFESSARIYFLTIQNKNLNSIRLDKGPFFWSETEKTNGKYWRRRYKVSSIDANKDGSLEVLVSDGRSSRVYQFSESKGWTQL